MIGVGVEKDMICFRCHQKISPKANYLELNSFNNKELIESVKFHLFCWGEFNQQKVNERITEMADVGMKLLKGSGIT